MNLSTIFKIIHSSNDMQLTPITKIPKTSEVKTLIETIKDLNMDINNFYKAEGKLYPYCYVKDTVVVEVYNVTKEYFINFHIKEMMEQRHKQYNKCIADKNYSKLFCLIDKPFRFKFYKKLFNQIPNEQKYKIFRDVYTSSEYEFNELSENFVEEIFKYNNSSKDWFDKKDTITIYRGETDDSTPYTQAYSWTTDVNVAEWFANRFNSDGKVYKGYVKQKDMLDYIDDRNEKEVLVLPKNVFGVELI